jgi:hypothetical protein
MILKVPGSFSAKDIGGKVNGVKTITLLKTSQSSKPKENISNTYN